jgi:hypothetical protein
METTGSGLNLYAISTPGLRSQGTIGRGPREKVLRLPHSFYFPPE